MVGLSSQPTTHKTKAKLHPHLASYIVLPRTCSAQLDAGRLNTVSGPVTQAMWDKPLGYSGLDRVISTAWVDTVEGTEVGTEVGTGDREQAEARHIQVQGEPWGRVVVGHRIQVLDRVQERRMVQVVPRTAAEGDTPGIVDMQGQLHMGTAGGLGDRPVPEASN